MFPFLLQGAERHTFTRSGVPVGGIGAVAFLAVQVGVDPGAGTVFNILRYIMCPVPVAFTVPPHGLQGSGKSLRRRRLFQASYKGR